MCSKFIQLFKPCEYLDSSHYHPHLREGSVFILHVYLFLVWRNIITISRPGLSINVNGSRSRHFGKMRFLNYWTPNSFAVTILWYECSQQGHLKVKVILGSGSFQNQSVSVRISISKGMVGLALNTFSC